MPSMRGETDLRDASSQTTVGIQDRRPVRSLLLLLVIPIAFFLISFQLTRTSGPEWLGANFENSYVYLLNSLLIAQGKAPSHVDHPGTTTQLFGALCLLLSGHGSDDHLVDAVISNPEPFLKVMHGALLVFVALAIWICPWLMTQYSDGDVVRGILVQIPTLLFTTIFSYSIWFGSDLFLIIPSLAAISICVFLVKRREESGLKPSACALAGLVCGLGITTKLTFFPLILVSVYCCRGLRSLIWFTIGLALPILIVVALIHSRFEYVLHWITGLSTHSGYYGGGEVGFARMDTYLPDVIRLLAREPALALIPVLSTATIIVASFRATKGGNAIQQLSRTAVILFLLQLISFLVIAKHANHHYLIVVYLSTGLNLVLLYDAIGATKIQGLTTRSAVVLALLLGVCGINSFLIQLPSLYRVLRYIRTEQLAVYRRMLHTVNDGVRVDYYRSVGPEFAFYFSNNFAGRGFSGILKEKYPRALFYNIFAGTFEDFDQQIDRSTVLREHDHLYFFGNPDLFNSGAFGKMKYFQSPNLHELYRQGGYSLQEWFRGETDRE